MTDKFLEGVVSCIGDSEKVKVEIEWLGEGWDGDYDESNPDDKPFLRFSVYKLEGGYFETGSTKDPYWESIDDSSYCTLMPATCSPSMVMRAAKYILGNVEQRVLEGLPIKKTCEGLSWIKPGWFRKHTEKDDEEDIT